MCSKFTGFAPAALVGKVPTTGFILGAGLGTRLRPLTENTPKPLLLIAGRPLVARAMDSLVAAGVRHLIVNTHHCPEAWPAAFPSGEHQGAKLTWVYEPELLDTGGGLANIVDRLSPEDTQLIIWNGDILSGCDLAELSADHIENGAEATLLVRKTGPNRNVRVAPSGAVTDLRDRLGSTDTEYQYTGICIVSRTFAQSVPRTAESLIEHFLRRIAAKPGSIRAVLDASSEWDDIGTPEAYNAVRSRLEPRAALSPEALAQRLNCELILNGEVARGGSARKFLRATYEGKPAILCLDDGSKSENKLYGPLAKALGNAGLRVPSVLGELPDEGALLLEDLGEHDLLSAARGPVFPWMAYASAIEQVVQLHREGQAAAQAAGINLSEPFSSTLYKWERDYFTEHVLAGVRLDRGVADEMASLSAELLRQPMVTVHRDFQSQNILVREGSAWLIDFQGMRLGCAAYDFASLAFDPYVTRSDMQLWRVEIEDHAREASDWKGSRDAFSHLLHVAATQRLLQACGAYGNLGRRQGRADFLAHLPSGLINLAFAATLCGRRRLATLATELAAREVGQKKKGK